MADLDPHGVPMCSGSQAEMEQGAEGLSQWPVAPHQFTEVSPGVPGTRFGAGGVEGSRDLEGEASEELVG